MKVMNRWMRLCAVTGAAFLGACAHKPAVKSEGAASTPPAAPPAVSKASPPAPQAADRSRIGEQALLSMLQQTVVRFEFNSAQLTPESQTRLQKLAEALTANRSVPIRIAGHCDERGTEEYNLALGQKRAEVAKTYLATLGVEPSRIETISYGEERPLDPRQTDEAWSANRRDEFSIRGR
jgi:peptidoglycan-associated lipoprotein